MIDATKYISQKEKGLTELAKIKDAYAVYLKKFDSETGEEVKPEITAVDIEELTTKKQELQKQITDIDTLVADIKTLG